MGNVRSGILLRAGIHELLDARTEEEFEKGLRRAQRLLNPAAEGDGASSVRGQR
jgi:hypothetical protein